MAPSVLQYRDVLHGYEVVTTIHVEVPADLRAMLVNRAAELPVRTALEENALLLLLIIH